MTTAVIIVAAGSGTRVGGDTPKQWRDLSGQPVLQRTVRAFSGLADVVVVVLNADDHQRWDALDCTADIVVDGGDTRNESVKAGLLALQDTAPEKVLIHDAARPLASPALINSVIDALDDHQAAAPAIAVTDALWQGQDDRVLGTQDRAGLYRAQTPQGFQFSTILAAHNQRKTSAADDVEVARDAGIAVKIVDGDADNIKITTEEDFARAQRIMMTNIDIRTGNGYDVHRFGDGDHVWLCGIKIPHGRSLQGHSDADVGMHALTDAIYGALGQGDIGQHFPPSDPQWKGAESHIFLRHAVELARAQGYEISNIDCTLVCEFPKVGPHQSAMKLRLSEIMNIGSDRISVKATTSERLGFTGREEGIASIATATLVKS